MEKIKSLEEKIDDLAIENGLVDAESVKAKKPHTSSKVKNRYNSKVYYRYSFMLRKDKDADIIHFLEREREHGHSSAKIIKKAIRKEMEK